MSIMVTGAAGFIGSHLVDRLLNDGEHVLGVDNLSTGHLANLAGARSSTIGRFQFQRLDITSTALPDYIARTKPELIYHLAAQVDVRRSVKDPIDDAMVNVIGTLNLLRAAADSETRKVVFASSGVAIYGQPDESRVPVSEDQVAYSTPTSPFGISKKIVLEHLRYYRSTAELDYTALALSSIYGPRQNATAEDGPEGHIVAAFIQRMLARRPCTIHGDGTHTRDLLYVDDAVGAFLAARDRAGGELVNVGSGREVTIADLYSALAELTNNRLEPVFGAARPGDAPRVVVDPSKAAEVLEWSPWTDLGEGLKQTVAWFRAGH
jgi:UDP-glucose 4-epimerase